MGEDNSLWLHLSDIFAHCVVRHFKAEAKRQEAIERTRDREMKEREGGGGKREREGGEGERKRERERQTDRQTDRQGRGER